MHIFLYLDFSILTSLLSWLNICPALVLGCAPIQQVLACSSSAWWWQSARQMKTMKDNLKEDWRGVCGWSFCYLCWGKQDYERDCRCRVPRVRSNPLILEMVYLTGERAWRKWHFSALSCCSKGLCRFHRFGSSSSGVNEWRGGSWTVWLEWKNSAVRGDLCFSPFCRGLGTHLLLCLPLPRHAEHICPHCARAWS